MFKIGFRPIGLKTSIQTLTKLPEKELTNSYYDNILLQKIKPKNREEALDLMNNLRKRYKGYNFEFGNNSKEAYVRAFSLDAPKIYTVSSKWYMGAMRFLRSADKAFADLFYKERMANYEKEQAKKFVEKMRFCVYK